MMCLHGEQAKTIVANVDLSLQGVVPRAAPAVIPGDTQQQHCVLWDRLCAMPRAAAVRAQAKPDHMCYIHQLHAVSRLT